MCISTKKLKGIIWLVILIILFNCNAQSKEASDTEASISGYVKDKETSETLVGASVFIEGTRLGAYTNKSGFYSITNIPAGERNVIVSSLGYKKYEEKIRFKHNEPLRKDFKLNQGNIQTGEVFVEAEKNSDKREITISKVDIPMSQLREIRIGGEADVFRSLQFLPGILTSSQLSSGLFVRGGSPDQNLVLIDGTVVYNPTHLFGFISTFNSDAIKDVELIKGGFPAEYGDRLSAVLNITQKDGNREEVKGQATLGLISSKAEVEGPLGNGSWFIGGRSTYFDLIKPLIPTDPQNPLPGFYFYDVNAKMTQDISDNDKISLSGFLSADALAIGSGGVSLDLNIGNRLGALKWTHIYGDNLFSSLILSGSHYLNNFNGDQSGYQFLINNYITDYTLKGSLEWFTSDKITHKFGFELTNYQFGYLENFTGNTDSTQQGFSGGTRNITAQDWDYSVYGQVNWQPWELYSIQMGLRANYWTLSKFTSLEPRIALRYQFQENIAFKAAFGIYHQNLRLATEPDFSFFDTWLPTDTSLSASKAIHYIFSIETKPTEDFDLNFDIYYKKMYNLSELNMTNLQPKVTADLFYIGNANSYGAEIFLQKKIGRLTGWIGYALGFINSQFDSINNGQEFRPKYDRRHDLKIVAQFNLNERWDFGASFIFQSGQSYTGATSRFQIYLPDQNLGRGVVVPSQRYGLRLPPSHQLNVSATYSFKTFGLPSKLMLDIYNVYNRKDIWFRYYRTVNNLTTVQDVRLLPILPSISYEVKF